MNNSLLEHVLEFDGIRVLARILGDFVEHPLDIRAKIPTHWKPLRIAYQCVESAFDSLTPVRRGSFGDDILDCRDDWTEPNSKLEKQLLDSCLRYQRMKPRPVVLAHHISKIVDVTCHLDL